MSDKTKALQALLHYAETPGDFTKDEAGTVLADAQAILYPETTPPFDQYPQDPNRPTVVGAAPDVADLTVSTDGRAVYFGAGTAALIVWLEQAFPAGTWIDDEDGRPWYRVRGARFAPGMVGLAAEFFPPKTDAQ